MDCSACGQPGAWKCLSTDDMDNPTGDWIHAYCVGNGEDIAVYGDSLSSRTIGHRSVSRGKAIVVPRMRRRGNVLFQLATSRVLQKASVGKLRRKLC
jgi:hypothetical protein